MTHGVHNDALDRPAPSSKRCLSSREWTRFQRSLRLGASTWATPSGHVVAIGKLDGPGRRYFRKNDTRGTRTHQIHLFAAGSPEIERHLAFRDFMTTHGDEARQYSELKQTLAAAHPHDIEACMAGEDAFIKAMERTALALRYEERPSPSSIEG